MSTAKTQRGHIGDHIGLLSGQADLLHSHVIDQVVVKVVGT